MTEAPKRLRILVADERRQYLEPVSRAVKSLGYEVIAHGVEIAEVGHATHDHRPDVAIVVLHEHSDHALGLIAKIVDEAVCPVVVLADDAHPDFVADAAERGVFAHIDSIDEGELRGGIDVALQRYRQWQRLLGAFDRRARIERAKGVLMERYGIDDREAFDRIRKHARDSRRSLIDVAEDLLGRSTASGMIDG